MVPDNYQGALKCAAYSKKPAGLARQAYVLQIML